jgi:Tol biopolymer transport system component
LGGGGLGEVYKAEDIHARRIVAQRVLSQSLISNDESKRRFFEEAAAALELDHPNICAVYDAADTGDLVFLASEYLEGLTLENLLRQGPFHPEDAVNVARQVALALQAGQSLEIVHRGIKPSNIILMHAGSSDPLVKVTDFGLAYLAGQSKMHLNGKTQIAVAYISPEQTQWTTTDHRTDVWSLGVVLYEMLTARRPFRGDDGASIIRSVLSDQYEPASKLRSGLPAALDEVIGRCLSKDPDERYQTAGELAEVLESVLPRRAVTVERPIEDVEEADDPEVEILPDPEIVEPEPVAPAYSPPPPPMELALPPWRLLPMFRPGRERLWKTLAGVALGLAIAAVAYHFLSRPDPRLRKYSFSPAGVEVPEGRAAISPNGRYLAYVAGTGPSRLFVQDLGEDAPREIEGSEGASRPFWSPDSQWIGFLAAGDIKKAPLDGGAVKTVCAVSHTSDHFSASWSPDGRTIVFSGDTPHRVFRAPAGGGYPEVLIEPADGQPALTFAQYLPGGNSLLVATGAENGEAAVFDVRTGERRDLGIRASFLTYSPTGHLLYQDRLLRSGPLWAVRFSPGSGEIDGEPFQVRERGEWPTVSSDGTLAYRDPGGPWVEQLAWRARNGDTIGVVARVWQRISQPTFSRDGRRILVAAEDADYSGIWAYDAVANQWVQETSGKTSPFLAQSPFDDRFVFSTSADGVEGLFAKVFESRGGGGARPLLPGSSDMKVTDWTRDGAQIIFHRKNADGPNDIWRAAAQPSGAEPVALIRSPNDERDAALSRDGRWVAYVSNRSGGADIYVAPFPAGGPETRVSREGGTQPRWSPTGDELYFVHGDRLMAVTVSTSPAVAVSKPKLLFSDPGLAMASEPGERRYDVAPDGQRFIVVSPSLESGGTPAAIRVTENWFEEFR